MIFDKKDIPNILTISRIILVPFSLLLLNDKLFYVIYMVLVQVTDILDGYLARKWKVTSSFGRIFDSYADYIYQGFLIYGIFFYMKSYLSSDYILSIICFLTVLIPFVYSIIKRGHVPQLHLNSNRLCWGLTALFFIFSIFVNYSSTFYIIVTLGFIIAGIDRLIYYIVYEKENELVFPSSLHLLNFKKQS